MSYLLRKFSYYALALFTIISLTFFLAKAIPGDPLTQEQALPQEILDSLRTHYGLNKPLTEQYLSYLKASFTFNFGPSLIFKGVTVNQIILEAFPISASLGLAAMMIALSGGIFLGCLAALYRFKWQEKILLSGFVVGISIPSFIAATLLQYVFAIKFGLFPIARWGSFSHLVLPALSLAILPMAFIARLIHSQVMDVLKQDYIKTARAKGLSFPRVILFHTLRNSISPVLNYFGPLAANILTGSFVVEKIYGIPGLGHWFVTSVMNRDYTFIMGTTVFYSLILLTFVFLTDIVQEIIDPRIRKAVYAS